MDIVHKNTLVLEDITLGFHVKLMISRNIKINEINRIVTSSHILFLINSFPNPNSNLRTQQFFTLTYKCLSIFLASRYFLNNRLKTLCRLIHKTAWGIRAFAVPFLLPGPVWRPLRLASSFSRTRKREWITWGFLIISPSFINLRMFWPEEQKKRRREGEGEGGHWGIGSVGEMVNLGVSGRIGKERKERKRIDDR